MAFVVIARPSPSVLRAAAMGCVALLALVTGRRKQAIPALAASVVVLLALSPSLAVDFGFALSVFATAGLVVVSPALVTRLRARGWPRWLAEMCAVALAAFVVTAPLVAAMSGTVSIVSIVANVLVAPAVAPITVVVCGDGGAGCGVAARGRPARPRRRAPALVVCSRSRTARRRYRAETSPFATDSGAR